MRKIDATLEAVTGYASLTATNLFTGANRITGVFTIAPAVESIPANIGDVTFSAPSDTSLEIRRRGSDNGVWVVALTLTAES